MVPARSFVNSVLIVLLTFASARGQERPLFSTNTDLVVLHVTVKDNKGTYLSGLSREQFGILEDGRPQTIRVFTSEDAPVTVGLLIDNSSSMWSTRERVIAAATSFAEASHPDDEMFALAFNERVRAALPPSAPFTSDSATLRAALTRAINARGRTALFDAVEAGLAYLAQGQFERKVLVVLSDGGDNASETTFDHVITKTQASNAVIYTVALVDPDQRGANPKVLKQIAEASGGEAFRPANARQVANVLLHIARDIRHTYTMGYVPTNTAHDGAFRRLRVIVESPDRRRLTVRTRGGYLAGSTRTRRDADGR